MGAFVNDAFIQLIRNSYTDINVAKSGCNMKSYSITDVGIKRKVNQDFVYCRQESVGALPNLFIVADGMGGHNAGDYASRTCVNAVTQFIKNDKELKTPVSILEAAVARANEQIITEARADESLEGMGTTFVGMTLIGDSMYVANVGDSRLYVINKTNRTIRQVTEDHSLVEEMVRNGEVERKNARFHPNKNIITRALGAADEVLVDFFEVNIKDDFVVMCSDGLSNMMDDAEIMDTVLENADNLTIAGCTLVQKANDYGGKDNISVIIVEP